MKTSKPQQKHEKALQIIDQSDDTKTKHNLERNYLFVFFFELT